MILFLCIVVYVKVNLYHEEERICKWKTSRKKSSRVFNEACALDLSQLSHDKPQLEVVLLASEHVHLRHYHTIGMVQFGYGLDGYITGEKHWRRAFDNPKMNVTGWHPLFVPPRPTSGSSFSRSRRRSASAGRRSSVSQHRSTSPSYTSRSPSPVSPSHSPGRSQSRSPVGRYLKP